MNGSLRRLRLVSTVASLVVTVLYVLTRQVHDPMVLAALIGWNITTLGLYRWQGEK